MEITVKMTPKEYDLFRDYQKDKASLERETTRAIGEIRADYERLCAKVLSALETAEINLYNNDEIVESSIAVSVKDQCAAQSALEIAREWYA